MSKAGEWAKRAVRDLVLRQMGATHGVSVFLVLEDGVPGMRIDNAGPFNKRESLRLARWIQDAFGEEPR
jgi:hypothetical protein